MVERPRQLTEPELERALAHLGGQLAYPPTPDLVLTLRQRLAAAPARSQPLWGRFLSLSPLPRSLALAALALVLLAGAVLALSPPTRSAVAGRLGLRGITIGYEPSVPAPTPAPLGAALRLGRRLTLPEAQARVSYRILTPSLPEVGPQDEVYLVEPPAGGQVALVYRARPGLPPAAQTGVAVLLTQFRGDLAVDPALYGKMLGPGTRLEQVTVNGAPGVWIEGRPHAFFYRDARGQVRDETVRLAGNVLLWEQGGLTLRLESPLSKAEALRIAASVR